jgi:hypothetical protein
LRNRGKAGRRAEDAARLVGLFALVAVIGCGAHAPMASPYLTLDGNWVIVGTSSATPPVPTTPIAMFTGSLESNGPWVTGTLRAFDPDIQNPCIPYTQDLPFSGIIGETWEGPNTVSFDSAFPGGSGSYVLMSAALSTDLQTPAKGTMWIGGGSKPGPCDMQMTNMTMMQIAPVTGTYVGTLTGYNSPGTSATVTAVLMQATAPDADGRFPLTGTVTTTGICPGTYSLSPEVVTGGTLVTTGTPPFPSANIVGTILTPTANIQASVAIYNVNCLSAPILDGTLTQQ